MYEQIDYIVYYFSDALETFVLFSHWFTSMGEVMDFIEKDMNRFPDTNRYKVVSLRKTMPDQISDDRRVHVFVTRKGR